MSRRSTDNNEVNHDHTYRLNLLPGLVTSIVVLSMLTGNCKSLGFEKDYVGQYLDAKAAAP